MTAEQFLILADALHSYARHSGRDLNDSHLFVHDMLMRAIKHQPIEDEECAFYERKPTAFEARV